MFKENNLKNLLLVLFVSVFCSFKVNAAGNDFKIFLDDDGPTITDFASADKACKDIIGGTIPDSVSLKKIVAELGGRLKAQYYWSSTIDTNCGATECRIQIEKSTLNERSENASNPTGALICTTEQDDNQK